MMRTVSVIFYTGDTYSYLPSKEIFVELKEIKVTKNIEGISKGLDISVFGIVEYSVSSKIGYVIVLRDQAYYDPGLPKDLDIIHPEGICASKGYTVTFINHCHDENGQIFRT